MSRGDELQAQEIPFLRQLYRPRFVKFSTSSIAKGRYLKRNCSILISLFHFLIPDIEVEFSLSMAFWNQPHLKLILVPIGCQIHPSPFLICLDGKAHAFVRAVQRFFLLCCGLLIAWRHFYSGVAKNERTERLAGFGLPLTDSFPKPSHLCF